MRDPSKGRELRHNNKSNIETQFTNSGEGSGETMELPLPLSPLSPLTYLDSEEAPSPPIKEQNISNTNVNKSSPMRKLSSKKQGYLNKENVESGQGNEGPKLRRWVSSASSRNPNLRRHKSRMINKDRAKAVGSWTLFSWLVTCCFPPFLLKCFGMKNREVQQAWREKIALVLIIILVSAVLGFLTFALESLLCGDSNMNKVAYKSLTSNQFSINGVVYDTRNFVHPEATVGNTVYQGGFDLNDPDIQAGTKDLSFLFQTLTRQDPGSCDGVLYFTDTNTGTYQRYFPCVPIDPFSTAKVVGNNSAPSCHFYVKYSNAFTKLHKVGDMFFKWEQVADKNNGLIVYGGNVLDLSRLNYLTGSVSMYSLVDKLMDKNGPYLGKDVSYYLRNEDPQVGKCLTDLLRVGMIDTSTVGCLTTSIIQYIIMIVIIGVVISKFFMAIFFSWIVSWRLGSLNERTYKDKLKRYDAMEAWVAEDIQESASNSEYSLYNNDSFMDNVPINPDNKDKTSRENSYKDLTNYSNNSTGIIPSTRNSFHLTNNPLTTRGLIGDSTNELEMRPRQSLGLNRPMVSSVPEIDPALGFALHYTISLVTCYSEGLNGIKSTLDSLANADYPNNRQLLFVVCDGIITGAGNDKTTPDICLSLMKDFIIAPEMVQPHSYVSIAEGSRRHNMAKVYAGYYYQTRKKPSSNSNNPSHQDQHENIKTQCNNEKRDLTNIPKNRVPMILVVKCGTIDERHAAKPGNRGKRDSQVLLMSFLQKAIFDDRMTELEYELFNAVWNVANVTPDLYETVLMVDADTMVFPDALTRMVACFSRDPKVMGLCGETKIANKTQSWVTMIQVFEYYISHHLSKAFESVFGGVTCLPGCFSMYRIKAPKPNGEWVPILCNPEILQQYSENVVTSLHQKNLLLLGEDRYLTTLMLRTFPKRKLIFVPQAICKTVVPDEFKVLLSQRRRWINSTVHNLLELVITRDLCGTFCFSMQFIVFMELVGTAVLPAAICFTVYLLVKVAISPSPPIIPLVILALILGLPAILILLTTRQITYVFWMIVYLLALPIWNFVLPVYAFWHFDDFSWGQTRQISGGSSGGDKHGHGSGDGEFDAQAIVMKRWEEFERDKRRRTVAILSQYGTQASLPSTIVNEPYKFGNSAKNLALNPDFTSSRQNLPSTPTPNEIDLAYSKNESTPMDHHLDIMGYMSPSALRRVSKVFAAEEEITSILSDQPYPSAEPNRSIYPYSSSAQSGSPYPSNPLSGDTSMRSLPWRSVNSVSRANGSRLSLLNLNNGSTQGVNGSGNLRHSMFDPTFKGNVNKN